MSPGWTLIWVMMPEIWGLIWISSRGSISPVSTVVRSIVPVEGLTMS